MMFDAKELYIVKIFDFFFPLTPAWKTTSTLNVFQETFSYLEVLITGEN